MLRRSVSPHSAVVNHYIYLIYVIYLYADKNKLVPVFDSN